MANYLRYTYQIIGSDSTVQTHTDVDQAKARFDFSAIDFTGLSPEWTLEDSNQTLVLKVPFTDAQAHTDMKVFHNNMKDTWIITTADSTLVDIPNISNKYVINDIELS